VQVFAPQLVDNFPNYPNKAAVKSENGRQMIVTKNFLNFARERFNCPTLAGVLGENDGSAGATATVGHIEQSVYYVRLLPAYPNSDQA
jgi:hypothetical protein